MPRRRQCHGSWGWTGKRLYMHQGCPEIRPHQGCHSLDCPNSRQRSNPAAAGEPALPAAAQHLCLNNFKFDTASNKLFIHLNETSMHTCKRMHIPVHTSSMHARAQQHVYVHTCMKTTCHEKSTKPTCWYPRGGFCNRCQQNHRYCTNGSKKAGHSGN